MLPLLFIVPILWLIGPGRASDTPWRWGPELLLAVGCGLLMGPLCGFWLAEFSLVVGEHITSDFSEYCEAVIVRSRGDLENFSRNRSLLAALPAALLLPRFGLVDAMTAPGMISVGVMATGAYLWGRALHGRLAGMASAMAIGVFTPMVLLSRMMSFYPEITAGFTLAAGLVAVAARVRTPLALLLGSLGAALCPLIDMRGIVFGLPFLAVVVLAACAAPIRLWLPRLAIPTLSTILAWRYAHIAYLPHSASLEGQVFLRQRLKDRGIPIPAELQELLPTAYVWGQSNPLEIPATLLNLRTHSAIAAPLLQGSEEMKFNMDIFIAPWTMVLPAVGIVAVLGLLRSPKHLWRVAVLALTCAPFALSLQGAINIQQAFLRFVAAAEPWLAVLLGLAFATVVEGRVRTGRQDGRGHLRLTAAALVWLLLVVGAIPSYISPVASWRARQNRADQEVIQLIRGAEQGNQQRAPVCVQQLMRERRQGEDPYGSLFGGISR